jgi:hypothetical protein
MVMFGNALAQRRAALVSGDPSMTPGAMPQMAGFGGAPQSSAAAPFAPPPSYGTPPIYDPTESQGMPMPGTAEPADKPGFFDRDGMGLNLLGGLSDGVLALNGMAPVYAPAQQHRQERRDKLQDASASRQQQIQTWIAQQQYKQQHPDPVAPSNAQKEYEFYSGLRDTGKITPEQFNAWQASQLNPLTWLRAENGDGSVTMAPVPKGGLPGAAPPQPAPAGVTFTPLPAAGGASPSGSRTFR